MKQLLFLSLFIVGILSLITYIIIDGQNHRELNNQSIDTTGTFLDKMSCKEILQFVQDVVIDQHAKPDAITSKAVDLRNTCLESVAKYTMYEDSHGNIKYLVNGTYMHLEMTH